MALLGTHSPEGVFVLDGPEVARAKTLDARILDIAPTVLAWLGIEVPQHMDGKVLVEAFNSLPEIRYHQTEWAQRTETEYTDAEQAEVERRLGDLGYL